MIPLPSTLRIWLAAGVTDMRLGMPGLALKVQEALGRDPFAGDVYAFRGRRGDLVKLISRDGIGLYMRIGSNAGISCGLRQRTERSISSRHN